MSVTSKKGAKPVKKAPNLASPKITAAKNTPAVKAKTSPKPSNVVALKTKATTPAKKALPITPSKSALPAATKPTVTAIPPSVQTLIDKTEISEILYRLARGIDRVDETLIRSVFHHEATLDLGPGIFQGTANDYVPWVIGVIGQVRSSHHMIANILCTMEGDVALVESYCHTHYRTEKPTGREDVFIGSRYLDRFERTPAGPSGVWKIMHRKQIIDWCRTEAASDLFYHLNPDALWSYRTKTDPSYQMAQFPGSQQGNRLPAFLGRRYDSKSVKF